MPTFIELSAYSFLAFIYSFSNFWSRILYSKLVSSVCYGEPSAGDSILLASKGDLTFSLRGFGVLLMIDDLLSLSSPALLRAPLTTV